MPCLEMLRVNNLVPLIFLLSRKVQIIIARKWSNTTLLRLNSLYIVTGNLSYQLAINIKLNDWRQSAGSRKNIPLPALAHQLPARPKSTPPSCSSWQGKGRAGCSARTLLESGVCFSAGDLGRRTCVLNAADAQVSKYYENKWVIHHWANNHTTPKPGTEWLCRALPEGEERLSQQWKQNWCGEMDFTFHWFG